MTFKQKLISMQIYIHTIFIVGLWILPLAYTIPTIIVCHIIWVGFCGTVFLHRVVTHKNSINPIIEHILLILSTVGCVSSAIAWAGSHRKHHRYSDTVQDPHSPVVLGKFKAYWQLSTVDSDIIRYVPELTKKRWYLIQHKHYFSILSILHILAIVTLPFNLYWALLVCPAFLMWFIGSVVNCFGHNINGPKNNIALSIITAGEGTHKNHHLTPANPNFNHWSDWGYAIFKLIKVK